MGGFGGRLEWRGGGEGGGGMARSLDSRCVSV